MKTLLCFECSGRSFIEYCRSPRVIGLCQGENYWCPKCGCFFQNKDSVTIEKKDDGPYLVHTAFISPIYENRHPTHAK